MKKKCQYARPAQSLISVSMPSLTLLDWFVIATYFGALVALVSVATRRQQTSTEYFLAGRNVGFSP